MLGPAVCSDATIALDQAIAVDAAAEMLFQNEHQSTPRQGEDVLYFSLAGMKQRLSCRSIRVGLSQKLCASTQFTFCAQL
jgi:hypothetical protein